MKLLTDWIKNDKRIWLMACLFIFSLTMGMVVNKWPSEFLVLVTGISTFAAIVICGRILPLLGDRIDRGIFIWSCSIGVILNMAVRIANDGYMPVLGLTEIKQYWAPMSGAALVWMGDWLAGNYSIGDILLIAGKSWAIYCVLRWAVISIIMSRLPKTELTVSATQSRLVY